IINGIQLMPATEIELLRAVDLHPVTGGEVEHRTRDVAFVFSRRFKIHASTGAWQPIPGTRTADMGGVTARVSGEVAPVLNLSERVVSTDAIGPGIRRVEMVNVGLHETLGRLKELALRPGVLGIDLVGVRNDSRLSRE